LGCDDIGINKSEFVTKTQFPYRRKGREIIISMTNIEIMFLPVLLLSKKFLTLAIHQSLKLSFES